MELKAFAGQNKSELSMIEVAHAILEKHGDAMAFADIVNDVQNYLGKSDADIRKRLGQFYTDLNVDGSFISLGENVWGLREWYPYESVDEEVNHPEDEEERPRKKRRRKVNAFLADAGDDDDVIDYNDDDPEDDDLDADIHTEDDEDDISGNHQDPVKHFKTDLSDLPDDEDKDDDDLDDGLEGQLSEFNDDEKVDDQDADFSADDDSDDNSDDKDDDDA